MKAFSGRYLIKPSRPLWQLNERKLFHQPNTSYSINSCIWHAGTPVNRADKDDRSIEPGLVEKRQTTNEQLEWLRGPVHWMPGRKQMEGEMTIDSEVLRTDERRQVKIFQTTFTQTHLKHQIQEQVEGRTEVKCWSSGGRSSASCLGTAEEPFRSQNWNSRPCSKGSTGSRTAGSLLQEHLDPRLYRRFSGERCQGWCSGAHISRPDGTTSSLSIPAGDLSSSYRTEVHALKTENWKPDGGKLPTAEYLSCSKTPCLLFSLRRMGPLTFPPRLCTLFCNNKVVVLRWVSAHGGIAGSKTDWQRQQQNSFNPTSVPHPKKSRPLWNRSINLPGDWKTNDMTHRKTRSTLKQEKPNCHL